MVSPSATNAAIAEALGFQLTHQKDTVDSLTERSLASMPSISPVTRLKAIKSKAEMEGFRACHIRDGAALVEFFAWLERSLLNKDSHTEGNDPEGQSNTSAATLTEYSVCTKLREFRSKKSHFLGTSFDTISSINSNGAVMHYKPSAQTALTFAEEALGKESNGNAIGGVMYLCDSGGQYVDGTTDVTRTLYLQVNTKQAADDNNTKTNDKLTVSTNAHSSTHAIASSGASQWQKTCYTAVLAGHVNLAMTSFPKGTTGYQLDVLARAPLWSLHRDYRHGTGHGVGHCLNVHEGPQSISPRLPSNEVALVPGMTVTNEPGYYEDGSFGIRIENVMMVVDARDGQSRNENKSASTGGEYFGFETVTMVPYARALIRKDQLSAEQVAWIDRYHQMVRERLLPELSSSEAIEWLLRETEPL